MRNYLLLTGMVCGILSCNQLNDKKKYQNNKDTVATNSPIASFAAKENSIANKKFIRTADIKFKALDVVTATYAIEDICNNNGGFVSFTNLTSNVDDYTQTHISADSILETTHYSITNTITLRIPNTKLDTALKLIAKNIDYLDYRIIKADDVGLQIINNDFVQTRSNKSSSDISNDIVANKKDLDKTMAAEAAATNKAEQADNAKLANLLLSDQIKFSTVNIAIYQKQAIKRNIVLNENNLSKYEIGFGYKLLESTQYGWRLLVIIIAFLAKFWALALLGTLIYWGYKWNIGRRKM